MVVVEFVAQALGPQASSLERSRDRIEKLGRKPIVIPSDLIVDEEIDILRMGAGVRPGIRIDTGLPAHAGLAIDRLEHVARPLRENDIAAEPLILHQARGEHGMIELGSKAFFS